MDKEREKAVTRIFADTAGMYDAVDFGTAETLTKAVVIGCTLPINSNGELQKKHYLDMVARGLRPETLEGWAFSRYLQFSPKQQEKADLYVLTPVVDGYRVCKAGPVIYVV